jgi:hypothetical protein
MAATHLLSVVIGTLFCSALAFCQQVGSSYQRNVALIGTVRNGPNSGDLKGGVTGIRQWTRGSSSYVILQTEGNLSVVDVSTPSAPTVVTRIHGHDPNSSTSPSLQLEDLEVFDALGDNSHVYCYGAGHKFRFAQSNRDYLGFVFELNNAISYSDIGIDIDDVRSFQMLCNGYQRSSYSGCVIGNLLSSSCRTIL